MAFQPTTNSTLTASQAELTSKIGSMKNILSLGLGFPKNIPKNQQISTFDYLVKIIKILGSDPQPLFQQFIDIVFSETSEILEEAVIDSIAAYLDSQDIVLSQNSSNAEYMKRSIPLTFLQTAKQAMAKQLMLMIFGPRDGAAAENLVPDASVRQRLIDDAICGTNMFTLSNNPTVRNEDLEYNRVRLAQQIENGEVQFEISCQQVKIKLPENPGQIFFGEGGNMNIPSRPVSPAQSITRMIDYIENQTQNINNQNNSRAAGKSFSEIVLEKLLSYISTLVFPHVGPIFAFLNQQPQTAQLTPDQVLYSNCQIESNPRNNQQKEFAKNIMNKLYKILLRILLLFVIREFKNLVANYFATTAREKARRKSERLRAKFNLLSGGVADAAQTAQKAQRYARAAQSLSGILGSDFS